MNKSPLFGGGWRHCEGENTDRSEGVKTNQVRWDGMKYARNEKDDQLDKQVLWRPDLPGMRRGD